jgi:hypothetical protein
MDAHRLRRVLLAGLLLGFHGRVKMGEAARRNIPTVMALKSYKYNYLGKL